MRYIAFMVYWIVYAFGLLLGYLSEGAHWLMWKVYEYEIHINEVFDLGQDLPTREELEEHLDTVMVEMFGDMPDDDDDENKGDDV